MEGGVSMYTPNSPPKKTLVINFLLKKYILVIILIDEHLYFKYVDPSLAMKTTIYSTIVGYGKGHAIRPYAYFRRKRRH